MTAAQRRGTSTVKGRARPRAAGTTSQSQKKIRDSGRDVNALDGGVQPPEIERFVEAVYGRLPDGLWGYLWDLQGKRTYGFSRAAAAAKIAARHAARRDVYCALALSTEKPGSRHRITNDEADGLVGLAADIDIAGPGHSGDKTYPPDEDAALALVGKLPLPPTIVVHSGGGLHAWWLFHEPWVFDGDVSISRTPLQAIRQFVGAGVEVRHVKAMDSTRSRSVASFAEALDPASVVAIARTARTSRVRDGVDRIFLFIVCFLPLGRLGV